MASIPVLLSLILALPTITADFILVESFNSAICSGTRVAWDAREIGCWEPASNPSILVKLICDGSGSNQATEYYYDAGNGPECVSPFDNGRMVAAKACAPNGRGQYDRMSCMAGDYTPVAATGNYVSNEYALNAKLGICDETQPIVRQLVTPLGTCKIQNSGLNSSTTTCSADGSGSTVSSFAGPDCAGDPISSVASMFACVASSAMTHVQTACLPPAAQAAAATGPPLVVGLSIGGGVLLVGSGAAVLGVRRFRKSRTAQPESSALLGPQGA